MTTPMLSGVQRYARAADLRDWRIAHNLTQAELARRLGVQPLAILRWEQAKRGIPPFLDLALAEIARQLSADEEETNEHVD